MGFYRRNIGGPQQMIRIAVGLAGAAAAAMLAGPPYGLLGAAAGAMFALTGIVGYCPFCAVAGLGRGQERGR